MKHQVQISLPVELVFEMLSPLLVDGTMLPEQLDITKVLLTVVGPSGKTRQVDIFKNFEEDQVMLWEDQIWEDQILVRYFESYHEN